MAEGYGRYREHPEYQIARQRARAKRAGMGGTAAVPNALMQDEELERAMIDKEMRKVVQLKKMGAQKKRQDWDVDYRNRQFEQRKYETEANLAQARSQHATDYNLRMGMFGERQRQSKAATRLSMLSIPLNIGFGVAGYFDQKRKAKRLENLERDLRLAYGLKEFQE